MNLLDESAVVVPSGEGHAAAHRGSVMALAAMARHQEVRRLVAYLIAGGISAVMTIAVTALCSDVVHLRFLFAAIVGTECGILVNFSINDRFAFRDLQGRQRRLPARLLRFHTTCAFGQTLILLISLLLHDAEHLPGAVAQAIPIVIVTAVNFMLHRLWTYRGRPPVSAR